MPFPGEEVRLTLITGFGDEERFSKILLERFEPRIGDALEFAVNHRVLLLRAKSGVGLDVALGALAFEESVVDRATLFAFPDDLQLLTCSAEDLIVLKAFAARPKDWIDIEGVIIRQTGKLNWPYIKAQLTPLAELKGTPEIVDELERRRLEFEQ